MGLAGLIAAALAVVAPPRPVPLPAERGAGGAVPVRSETRPTLGTLATVTVAGEDAALATAGIEAAFAIFDRVTWSMNEWAPGTPLSRLNAEAGRDWVALPGDLCEALAGAKAGAERTGGAFDPTWAALRDLWRFEPGAAPPAPAVLRERCGLVDHRALSLRPRHGGPGCEARLVRAGMAVGLGGYAKGHALDVAARALRALGLRDFVLQAGGDLYAAGTRAGAPWRVGVRDPRGGAADALLHVEVRDAAFSTSGDSENAFVADGVRYHHLLDPRTCAPSPASRSVTVLARTAAEAEVLGKALFLAGPRGAPALARALGGEAVVVGPEGEVLVTPGLAALVAGSRGHGGAR